MLIFQFLLLIIIVTTAAALGSAADVSSIASPSSGSGVVDIHGASFRVLLSLPLDERGPFLEEILRSIEEEVERKYIAEHGSLPPSSSRK